MVSPWSIHYEASESHLDPEKDVKYPSSTSLLLMSGEDTSLEKKVTPAPHESL